MRAASVSRRRQASGRHAHSVRHGGFFGQADQPHVGFAFKRNPLIKRHDHVRALAWLDGGGRNFRGEVRRRDYGEDGKRVEPQLKTAPPALEGIKFDGRWVVIYSKYDIGCALEKHSSPECRGHDPASALRLARAALLYSLRR